MIPVMDTRSAAFYCGVSPGSMARLARRYSIQPLRRIRAGRSTVTLWRVSDITRIALAEYGVSQTRQLQSAG